MVFEVNWYNTVDSESFLILDFTFQYKELQSPNAKTKNLKNKGFGHFC